MDKLTELLLKVATIARDNYSDRYTIESTESGFTGWFGKYDKRSICIAKTLPECLENLVKWYEKNGKVLFMDAHNLAHAISLYNSHVTRCKDVGREPSLEKWAETYIKQEKH